MSLGRNEVPAQIRGGMESVASAHIDLEDRRARSAVRRRQLREQAIELCITAIGFTGIAAIILIFIFVGKEAVPLLFDPHAIAEASFGKMFLPQVARAGRPAAFLWQPVGAIPK